MYPRKRKQMTHFHRLRKTNWSLACQGFHSFLNHVQSSFLYWINKIKVSHWAADIKTLSDLLCVAAENCTDKPEFSPSRLVVKHGDRASASCSVCQRDCINNTFGLEKSVGNLTTIGTTILWTVDSLTEWSASPMCYYTSASGHQCSTELPVTVYSKSALMSLSFII